jgi:hypothetical protein
MSTITEATYRLDPRTGRFHDRDGRAMEVVAEGEIEGLREQVARLTAAVRAHYEARADQRCWLDDDKLYHDALGLAPDPYVTALPPREDFLESCRRYHAQRQGPVAHGAACLPGGMTIAELTTEVARLTAERDLARAMVAMNADRLEEQLAERTLERNEARRACRLVLDGLREDLGGVYSIRLREEHMEVLRRAAE